VWWPDGFCRQLADRGFHVARFDNRDTGLSTHFESPRKQNPVKAFVGGTRPTYSTYDMLDDGLAVMDALDWPSAHVAGGSMGAGLAQAMALIHPDRVRSVTSINGVPITASKLRILGYINWSTMATFLRLKPGTDRDSEIESLTAIMRTINGDGYPFPEEWAHEAAGMSYDRSPRDPRTSQRQLAAGKGIRFPPLSDITVPVLVIGGGSDPLIKTRASESTAQQIPGAKLVIYPRMGHSFPAELWDDFVTEIADVARLPEP
ncbi:MAG: alpha/beta hydrolase, partial [Candidatus Nanopelagicales bacterium]